MSVVLYHDWFCLQSHKVRRALRRLELRPELLDVRLHPELKEDLRRRSGGERVPCLIVADEAVSGGAEILRFLELRFGGGGAGSPSPSGDEAA